MSRHKGALALYSQSHSQLQTASAVQPWLAAAPAVVHGYAHVNNASDGDSFQDAEAISIQITCGCSEGLWQRCWASSSNRTLLWGAFMGSCFITVAVFIFGFFGFLAIWSGLWQYDYEDPNSYNIVLFTLLDNHGQKVRRRKHVSN